MYKSGTRAEVTSSDEEEDVSSLRFKNFTLPYATPPVGFPQYPREYFENIGMNIMTEKERKIISDLNTPLPNVISDSDYQLLHSQMNLPASLLSAANESDDHLQFSYSNSNGSLSSSDRERDNQQLHSYPDSSISRWLKSVDNSAFPCMFSSDGINTAEICNESDENVEIFDASEDNVKISDEFKSGSAMIDFLEDIAEKVADKKLIYTWEDGGCFGGLPRLASESGCDIIETIGESLKSFGIGVKNDGPRLFSSNDIKNLLLGIQSDKFVIRKNECGDSEVSTTLDVKNNPGFQKLFEMAKYYMQVKRFCEVYRSKTRPNTVESTLVTGIEKYLQAYESTIIAAPISGFFPIELLKQFFVGPCIYLRYLNETCNIINELKLKWQREVNSKCCYGIFLISELHHRFSQEMLDPNFFTFGPIFYYCLTSYFTFLEQWMFEGVHTSIAIDFGILGNAAAHDTYNEAFWVDLFIDKMDLQSNILPSFLKNMRKDIILCGKILYLLKYYASKLHDVYLTTACIPNFALYTTEKEMLANEKANMGVTLAKLKTLIDCVKQPRNELFLDKDNANMWKDYINSNGINKTFPASLTALTPNMNYDDPVKTEDVQEEISKTFSLEQLCETMQKLEAKNTLKKASPLTVPWIANYPTGYRLVNDFVTRAANSLICENIENVKEVLEFIKDRDNVSMAMNRSAFVLVKTQIEVINRSVIHMLFVNEKLHLHLENLTNIFFLHNQFFRSAFSKNLFDMIKSEEASEYFYDSDHLYDALFNSLTDRQDLLKSLSLHVEKPQTTFSDDPLMVVTSMVVEYKVDFPCNIVITKNDLFNYNQVLKFLVQLQWPYENMKEMWFHVKDIEKRCPGSESSSHYRQLLAMRHKMYHLISVLYNYVTYMMFIVEWPAFMANIRKAKNVDDLSKAHHSYVQNVLKICVLEEGDIPLHFVIIRTLHSILKFNKIVLEGEWCSNECFNEWQFDNFSSLMQAYQLFTSLNDEMWTRLHQRSRENMSFQELEAFTVLINFNS